MKTRLERGKNMKKRKGFTLIELLAVIVILAIIALIAVPTVMNIISRANKSAFKDSAYGVLKAGENYYMGELLNAQGMTSDKVFDFSNDTSELEINGSKPTGGKMIVNKNGKVAMAIHNGRHCVTKGFNDDDVTITDDVNNCILKITYTNGIMSSENKCIVSGTCSDEEIKAGVLVNVKVSDAKNYDFYVVSNTANEVTLIMDKNLGEKVAWYGSATNTNELGPIAALNYLNTQTSDWDNIPAISNYQYDGKVESYGYQKLEIVNGTSKLTSKDGATITEITGVSRARLLTYEEATSTAIGCTTSSGSCPSWIYGNLSDADTTENPKGYWLLSARPSFSLYGRRIDYSGFVTSGLAGSSDGVRPVITLSK